jgi:hypothetical protein
MKSILKQGMHDQITYAVALDRVAIVQCLLDNGAEMHYTESMWKSIIRRNDSTKMFELCMDGLLLRAQKEKPDLTPSRLKELVLRHLEPYEISFLQRVATTGTPSMLKAFLGYGTEYHFDHGRNKNILHVMISGWNHGDCTPCFQQARIEKFRLLCEVGAYVGPSTETGFGIIHAAILQDMTYQAELVRLVINCMHPSSVHEQVSMISGTDELEVPDALKYVTPVVRVITKHELTMRDNRYDMLDILFKLGAKRNQLLDGQPIMFAALHDELTSHYHIRRPSCLDVIIDGMDKFDKKIPVNCEYNWMVMQTVRRENPRHASSRNVTLQILLSNGFDPNERDFLYGQTPLHYLIEEHICEYDKADECLIETLLRCETIDVNIVDMSGQNVLQYVKSQMDAWHESPLESVFDMSPLIYGLLYLKAEESIAKRDAFTLALHERLGAESHAQILSPEMIGIISGTDHFCHLPHPSTVFPTG